jgi:hypothetical protein
MPDTIMLLASLINARTTAVAEPSAGIDEELDVSVRVVGTAPEEAAPTATVTV